MNRNSSMQEMLRKREYEIVPDKRIKMLKNNSARDIFDSCNTKKVSKNQEEKIITSMLERFNQYQKRYEEKNKQLKEKLEMNRTKELKFKPKLNNYCSVGTEKVKKENFLTRSDNFIKQKNKKTEMIKKEREQKEKTYINPKLNKKEKWKNYNLDKEDRKYSSSGGVATVLSRHILENGVGSVKKIDMAILEPNAEVTFVLNGGNAPAPSAG